MTKPHETTPVHEAIHPHGEKLAAAPTAPTPHPSAVALAGAMDKLKAAREELPKITDPAAHHAHHYVIQALEAEVEAAKVAAGGGSVHRCPACGQPVSSPVTKP